MSVLLRLKWGAPQVTTRHARDEFARILPSDRLPGAGWELLDERAASALSWSGFGGCRDDRVEIGVQRLEVSFQACIRSLTDR